MTPWSKSATETRIELLDDAQRTELERMLGGKEFVADHWEIGMNRPIEHNGLGGALAGGRRRARAPPRLGRHRENQKAREAVFPLAAGFGCEAAMTADAMSAGLQIAEADLPLEHRATTRDLNGFLHRGRQLRDIVLAFGPQSRNHRGLRLPLVGWLVAVAQPSLLPGAAIGVADDLWSGEERGFRAHLRARRTTGILKLVGIPAFALWRTRSLSGAILVGLSANLLNQSTRSRAGRSRSTWRPRYP